MLINRSTISANDQRGKQEADLENKSLKQEVRKGNMTEAGGQNSHSKPVMVVLSAENKSINVMSSQTTHYILTKCF